MAIIKAYQEASRRAKFNVRGNLQNTIKEQMQIFSRIDDDLMPDFYGQGSVINEFEAYFADAFGKQKAVFFPSGTMAQQIMLRIWSDYVGVKRVAYHPLCHVEIHEQDGMKELHNIDSVLLGDVDRLFTIDDLKGLDSVSTVLFELPQREIGGQLPSWDELIQMIDYCKSRGYKVHLDGARIFECLPYYGKTLKEIGVLFDSIYISFYKGLGGVTGALLISNEPEMNQAIVWKRRHGGDLFHLYPYIITAKEAYEKRAPKMAQYHEGAKRFASLLASSKRVEIIPEIPVSNMFHVHFKTSADQVMQVVIDIMNQHNVALFGNIRTTENRIVKSAVSIGDAFLAIDEGLIEVAVQDFVTKLDAI